MTSVAARLLEVIVTSADESLAAEDGGAGRLELVADLARGGMTPAIGTVEEVLTRVRVPVRVMLRVTEAHESADAGTIATLARSAAEIGGLPVHGLVTGGLRGGEVDGVLLDAVVATGSRPLTFHRAIEAARDPERAIVALRRWPAIDRVLTSGGEGPWATRVQHLIRLSALGSPAITVIAGGGLTLDDIRRLASMTDIREIHVGRLAREPAEVTGRVSARQVRAVVRALAT